MAMGLTKNRSSFNVRKDLTLVDVMCPVCMGIFIEPVTLPCNHGLCLQCFENSVEKTSLTCPMCRKRIGGWLRQAKDKRLVNDNLWNLIQKKFPCQVQAKLNGGDDGISENIINATPPVRVSEAGEVRREYELEMKRLEEERRQREENEFRASAMLIKKLQEEDEEIDRKNRNQLKQLATEDEEIAKQIQNTLLEEEEKVTRQRLKRQHEDEVIAKQIQEEFTKGTSHHNLESVGNDGTCSQLTPVTPKGPLDFYIKSSTPDSGPSSTFCKQKYRKKRKEMESWSCSCNVSLDSNDSNIREILEGVNLLHQEGKLHSVRSDLDGASPRSSSNVSSCSNDSIKQEMHHFKPIKVVPRTPPKKMPDGSIIEPKLIKATPRNLNKIYGSLGDWRKPTVTLSDINLIKKEAKEKSVSPTELGNHMSAFKGTGFRRKMDQLDNPNIECETPAKKLCIDRVGAHMPDKTIKSNLSLDCEHSSFKEHFSPRREDEYASSIFSVNVSSVENEQCRSAMEDSCSGFGLDYLHPAVESAEQESHDSPSKLSTDSGKISLSEEIIKRQLDSCDIYKNAVEECNKQTKANLYNNRLSCASSTESNQHQVKSPYGEIEAVCDSGVEDDRLAEQARIEQMIRQEQADMELALRLQREWDLEARRVDRSKGSSRAYELRNATECSSSKETVQPVSKGRRQRTLEEAFMTSNRRLVSHSGS